MLVAAALCLWRGKEADTARFSLTIFSWTLVIGLFIATLWLSLNMAPNTYVHREVVGGSISLTGALTTGPLLRRVLLIMGALAIHALLYMGWAIGRLERTRRNVVATWLATAAVALALYSLTPQARFWMRFYNHESMQATVAQHHDAARSTDHYTADWAEQEPRAWEALLLRANYLYETGRKEEARAVDRRIVELPPDNAPDDLRRFILRRLDSGR